MLNNESDINNTIIFEKSVDTVDKVYLDQLQMDFHLEIRDHKRGIRVPYDDMARKYLKISVINKIMNFTQGFESEFYNEEVEIGLETCRPKHFVRN